MTARPVNLETLSGMEVRTCVVLVPPGGTCPPEVAEATRDIDQRETFDDALRAFAELALAQRLQRNRAGWGLQTSGAVCCVIVDPEQTGDVRAFVAAVSEYTSAQCLTYLSDESQPWCTIEGDPVQPSTSAHARQHAAAPPGLQEESAVRSGPGRPLTARTLRLVNQLDGPAAAPEPVLPAAQDDADLEAEPIATVTREEIAMLLDGDDPELLEESGS